jgi:HK97 family phage major capsid protein
MNSLTKPLEARRSILARSIVSMVNRSGPLSLGDRKTLFEIRKEMDALETDILSEQQRAYSGAFDEYLRRGYDADEHQAGLSNESRKILLAERRTMDSGGAFPGSSGGFFVPTEFEKDVASAQRYAGPMLDVSTVYDTATGAPLAYPADNDASVSGEMVAEDVQVTAQDIPISGTVLKSFKFSSRMIKMSIELTQDVGFPLAPYLAARFGTRIARAANPRFTTGTGAGEPTGFLNVASVGAVAVGSTNNTGGSESGNSIGTDDLANLELSLDPAYRLNASMMMHPNTANLLSRLKDKNGRPVYSDMRSLRGYPVVLNASMDTVPTTPSSPQVIAKTVAFGDFSKYVIRRAPLLVTRLSSRFAEFGQVAYLAIQRMDANLIDGDGNSIKLLANHF